MAFMPASARKELEFGGQLAQGSKGQRVRQLQEWLTFHGDRTVIDAEYGDATQRALRSFQNHHGLGVTGQLNTPTWNALVAPMQRAVAATSTAIDLPSAMLDVATAHLTEHPIELGGDNRGPWVRLYMNGRDGAEWLWCAGFVFFVMSQACAALGRPMPLKRTFSCDTLAGQARELGWLHRGEDIASGKMPWSQVGALSIFLSRRSPGDWSHTGLAFEGQGSTFSTVEGNTNDTGSSNGFEVCRRTRSLAGKDFVVLPP